LKYNLTEKKKKKLGIGDPNMVTLTHVVQRPRKFGTSSSTDYTKKRDWVVYREQTVVQYRKMCKAYSKGMFLL